VIEIERPDALLPTMGGQTALNLAVTLAENGTLERLRGGADRRQSGGDPQGGGPPPVQGGHGRIGVNVCPSGIANNLEEAEAVGDAIGSYPRIIRPAFTLGGSGGGIAYNPEDFAAICKSGLEASPVSRS
jgi:carbamoyl-phosphate synthase large subunit